jgi:hypothetical protein
MIGSRLVGIVHSQTQATEFSLVIHAADQHTVAAGYVTGQNCT